MYNLTPNKMDITKFQVTIDMIFLSISNCNCIMDAVPVYILQDTNILNSPEISIDIDVQHFGITMTKP